MSARSLVLGLLLATSLGCRPDPGVPDYTALEALLDGGSGPTGPLPGPVPYVPGTRRMAFGLFYEGGASDKLEVDDATRHYYIFGTPLTYAQQSSNERVEGLHSDELTFSGNAWWGGGLVWDTPVNLSSWTTLHVSVSSAAAGLAAFQVKLLHGSGATAAEVAVEATAYGWVNDGAWHHLDIPLSAFAGKGADLSKVRGPFVLAGVGAASGERLLVDNLYLD